jgi:cysteine-rich repeat protein
MNHSIRAAGRFLQYSFFVSALILAAAPASAASVSFYLDQSNKLPDGVNYLSVSLMDNDTGGVSILVKTLDPLNSIAGEVGKQAIGRGYPIFSWYCILAGMGVFPEREKLRPAVEKRFLEKGFVVLSALADSDGDEVPDSSDNCPSVANPNQVNTDFNHEFLDSDPFGDACDAYTCGDGIRQDAETCDEGELNGSPGSSCSANCTCLVQFTIPGKLFPGATGSLPIVILGSAGADASGCLNLDNRVVGGVAAKSIDPMSLRLSATNPTQECPTTGGSPANNLALTSVYNNHLADTNADGIRDLKVNIKMKPIGGNSSTTQLYLTGRFANAGGPLGDACFEAVAPVTLGE